jgi:TonB family protein
MIAIAWKATAVLIAAFCATRILQGRSAALRHFIWTAAFGAMLALPLSVYTPRGGALPGATIQMPAIVMTVQPRPAGSAPAPTKRVPWLEILYAAGVLLAASRFAAGALRTSWIVRHATASTLGGEFGSHVVFSAAAPMPMAWGILRPVVVLPQAAADWPAARLRAVLLHESMHHRRRDLLTQAIAQAACCLYWCNPLSWVALARHRDERERACDDAVLQRGIAAHDYATHLVDVVRAVASSRQRWSDAPAMADSSSLESRVRAVLDRETDRRPLTRRMAFTIAAAAIALLAPLAVFDLRAQAAAGTLTGVVTDPSGAVVPNCRVTAKNLDGTNQETAVTNSVGEYRLTGIPPGHYALEFAVRGFAVGRSDVTLVSGAVARVDRPLEVGHVSEVVTVSGRRSTPIVAPQVAQPQRIRVGGNVTPMRLVRQPRPFYPPELQQAGVEGTVMLKAIISKDGAVLHAQVVNSVDPRLAKAALDAVATWVYSPTLLNGEPVETLTSIDVNFELEK